MPYIGDTYRAQVVRFNRAFLITQSVQIVRQTLSIKKNKTNSAVEELQKKNRTERHKERCLYFHIAQLNRYNKLFIKTYYVYTQRINNNVEITTLRLRNNRPIIKSANKEFQTRKLVAADWRRQPQIQTTSQLMLTNRHLEAVVSTSRTFL